MKIAILMAMLIMSGCSDYPTDKEFKESLSWCDNFGGLRFNDFSASSGLTAFCVNGATVAKRINHKETEK